MAERLVELDIPFSTADTEGAVTVTFEAAKLLLTFQDWRLTQHSVLFEGVVAFKWDDSYLDGCEVAPDRTYEVHNSAWTAALRDAGSIGSVEQRRHFRVYFNAEGSALDVIASSLEKKA